MYIFLLPRSVPVCSSVPVELGVGFTFPSNNNKNPALISFDQTLKVGAWEHLEQISAVTVTFVQETFLLGTFFYIINISALTDLILTKL